MFCLFRVVDVAPRKAFKSSLKLFSEDQTKLSSVFVVWKLVKSPIIYDGET